MKWMSLILPAHLVHTRRFKCHSCSYAFIKQTPSQVEPCPMCKSRGITTACFERGKTERDLDSYSQTKLRWYQDKEGRAHSDEIRRRKTILRDGKKQVIITDSKGRSYGAMPIVTNPKKEIDWAKGTTIKTVQNL